MITTKQKWALGGLILLSAGVWTPQIMARFGGTTSAQLGIESGPGEDEMLSIEMGTMAPTTMGTSIPMGDAFPDGRSTHSVSPNGPATRLPSTGPGGSSHAGPSQEDDSMATQGAPTSSRAIVSEVLRTLRQSEAFGIAEEANEAAAILDSEELTPELEPELPPAIFTYLESHPLRGTIVGETLNIALIGQHRVRLGETVPGTAAVLVSVERGHATLEEGSLTIELELAPLQTSSTLMAARSLQMQNAGMGTAGPGFSSPDGDPASIPQPISPPPASNESNSVPTGSAGDF